MINAPATLRASSLAVVFTVLGCLRLGADGPSATPITDIDPAGTRYASWVDGTETDLPLEGTRQPGAKPMNYLWSPDQARDSHALAFGDSKSAGPRYLRVEFSQPVTIGSIITRGGGTVSAAKADAAVPTSLTDDSQWVTAERLKNGVATTAEAGPTDLVLWTFAQPVTTRMLRFTHIAQPSDPNYAGVLGGFALYPGRLANLAPQAAASATGADQYASRLNNESTNNDWAPWENISVRDGVRPQTIAESPESVMLLWPRPVTLQGLGLIGNEFGAADIQVYTGPEGTLPKDAADGQWQTAQTLTDNIPQAPALLDLIPITFASPVTTRAVRVRFTATYNEDKSFFRLKGHTRSGQRVALDQIMALQTLDAAPLVSVLPAPSAKAAPETAGLMPIKFTLPEAGEVTLVIEDANGQRVRNLVSQTPFPAGENTVWWDGTNDLGRDAEAPAHGVYIIPSQFVNPGTYHVRGLWHKPLDLRYEFSVYSPGDPPWTSSDPSSGWMTNHTPASAVVFMPAEKSPNGQPLIGLGSAVSEGGSAFSWLGLDGKKLGGRGWIGGAWTGAAYLAADSGPNAESGVATYVGSVFQGNKKYGVNGKLEIRLNKLTNLVPSGDKPVLADKYLLDAPPVPPPTADPAKFPRAQDYLGGLAVYNGTLVFSEPILNKIVFVDAKGGTVQGEASVPSPYGLAFDHDGQLLVLSGHNLLRFAAGATAANLPKPDTIVSGLDDPRGITLDSAGKIYVSDQGGSHQVKVFTADGKPAATFGKPGVPKAGLYDPLHMNNPKGLAVDSNGRLWVAEDDFYPKRVSVWNADGTLWKAYYGPALYGGGGILDSKQIGTLLYNGLEFSLDWDKGTYTLSRVYYRPDDHTLKLAFRDQPPEAPYYFNGKRYLADAYNNNGVSGHRTAFLFLDKGDGGPVVPVAGAGAAQDWPLLKSPEFQGLWPAGIKIDGEPFKNAAVFIWSDLNGDGQAQPDEVKIIAGSNGGVTLGNDGAFLISRLGPDAEHLQATRFVPTSFTGAGAPVYDINAGQVLAAAQTPGSDGHDQLLTGNDGWTVMTTPPPPFSKLGLGGAHNGTPAWSYPSLWPGLHASHTSPPAAEPGQLIGTTRLLGGLVSPKGSEAQPLFFINSNQGCIYAFTQDGLFVAQLFADVRQGPLWAMPTATRGMPVNGVSLHDENFFPSVAQTPEGQVYLDTGANMAIVRVNNLDTIRLLPQTSVEVSPANLKAANAYVVAREVARQASLGSGTLEVALRRDAPTVNGGMADWKNAHWAQIDHRGVAAYFDSHSKPYDVDGAVAIAGGKLLAAWETGDPKLIQNSGDVPNALFKSGGALDLMIGSDPKARDGRADAAPGDERLLVAQVDGKTKALLYRQVVPGTDDKAKVPFSAPWHGITFDQVLDVSDKVELTGDKDGNYEIAVPLSLLDLSPQPGMRVKGDIGILRGDGKQTTQRLYWANKATAIVSDVPTEAELTPKLWGTWEFEQK